MGFPPKSSVEMTDFPGLLAGADPRDFPEGAAEEQTNLTCVVLAELQVRPGYRQVTFEN